MNDQASTLRLMTAVAPSLNSPIERKKAEKTEPTKKTKNMHCLAITGGKGGVGKSNLAVNLALELGALGKQTMLLDADFGLGNADLLCGISPKYHLGHVIAGLVEPEDIQVSLSENVFLLPSGNGIEELANYSLTKHSYLLTKLQAMEDDLDFMVIDTAAGIAQNVVGVLTSAAEVIIVTTPDPTAMIDAYATIKVVLRNSPDKRISVVVNNVVGVGDAEQVFQQMSSAVKTFLKHKIEFLGMIPHDAQLVEAVRDQTPVVKYAPGSPSSRAVRLIAQQINHQTKKGFQFQAQSFWDMLAKS
jgi:flagellar biosynthesis protein FlhG